MFLQGLSDLHTWGFIPKERDGLGVGVKTEVPERPVCGAQSGEVAAGNQPLTFCSVGIMPPSALLLCHCTIYVMGNTACCFKMCVMREMRT